MPWSAIGVLFRTNAQSSLFEAALTRRGIPCRVPTGGRFVERPAGPHTARRAAQSRTGNTRGARSRSSLADLAVGTDEPSDAGDDRDPSRADDELREHRDALLRLGRDYLASEGGTGSVAGFVAWLDLATRSEQRGGPAVDLLTFHRAKGLEWRVVFVTGLELGLVPISWATAPAAVAEERRLLHVALGRAEDELHLSWARQRTVSGRRSGREPSPWLAALAGHARASAAEPVDPRDGLAAVRAALDAAQPPQPVPRGRGAAAVDGLRTRGDHGEPILREVAMARTTLPLFPTDDGWPYPDRIAAWDDVDDTEPDLDALELRADPHAFDALTAGERAAVVQHFGLGGCVPVPSKQLGIELGCSRAEARELLGAGIDKLRTRLHCT